MDFINELKNKYRKMRWNFFWNNFQLPTINLTDLIQDVEMVNPKIFDHLCLPPYHGPKDHDDFSPLLSLIRYYQPNIVLEIGTAHGATVANICSVSNAKVFTVNALPEQISGETTTFTLNKDDIGCVYKQYGFEDRVTQIFENSWEIDLSKYLQGEKIDFIIIDGCHDTEFILNDFFCVLPFITPQAIILFHDIGLSNSDPLTWHLDDGYIACMYLRKMSYNVKLLDKTWWAIWQAEHPKTRLTLQGKLLNRLDNRLRFKKRDIFSEARLYRLYMNQFLLNNRKNAV